MTNKVDFSIPFSYQSPEGEPPPKQVLFCAVEQGDLFRLKKLLSQGLDPNSRNEKGLSLLEVALTLFDNQNSPEKANTACALVEVLISTGGSYKTPIRDKYLNLFDYAFNKRNLGVLFTIHKYYTNEINISSESWGVFFTFCGKEDLDFIARYYPMRTLQSSLETVILEPPVHIDTSLIKKYLFLLDKNRKYTPSHAMLTLSPDITKQLIQKGVVFDERDATSYTPLQYLASGLGSIKTLSVLLKAGANPFVTTIDGRTLLQIAEQNKNFKFSKKFLKFQSNQFFLQAPLYKAILTNDISLIEKEYMNLELPFRNLCGRMALTAAIKQGSLSAVTFFSQHVLEQDLIFAASYSTIQIVSHLTSIINVDEDLIKNMYNKSFHNENDEVKIWILENYSHRVSDILLEYLETENKDQISLLFLQKCIQNIQSDVTKNSVIEDLFFIAAFRELSQIASLLLDHINQESFVQGLKNEKIFYHYLFHHSNKEFLEKALKKFGVLDSCLKKIDIFDSLINNHPSLFCELLPSFIERTLALPCEDHRNSLWELVALAHCAGTPIENYHHVLQTNPQEFSQYFCKKLSESTRYICISLKFGNETGIRFITQNNKTIYYPDIYRELSKTLNLEYITRTIKFQRGDFTLEEKELKEIAEIILQTSNFHNATEIISGYIQYTPSLEEVRVTCQGIAKFVEKLPTVCQTPYGHLSVLETARWFFVQIFCDIRHKNPALFCNHSIADTVLDLVTAIRKPNDYELVLTALQNAPTLQALRSACLLEDTKSVPVHKTNVWPLQILERRDTEGKTDLFRAVEQGNVLEVKKLLSLGCDPNSPNAKGQFPLEVALKNIPTNSHSLTCKTYTLIQLLVSRGAFQTQVVEGLNLTIFDFAFYHRNFGLLFALHTYYKPPIELSLYALNTFFLTCNANDVEFILRYYPTIDFFSLSHFRFCIFNNKIDQIVKWQQLSHVKFKIFLHIKNPNEDSLLCEALKLVRSEIVEYLQKQGASFDCDPKLLLISSEITKKMLIKGMNCNEQDSNGFSALHYIAHNPETIMLLPLLLLSGANPLITSKEGSTPLDIAHQTNNSMFIEIVEAFNKYKESFIQKLLTEWKKQPEIRATLLWSVIKVKAWELASPLTDFFECIESPVSALHLITVAIYTGNCAILERCSKTYPNLFNNDVKQLYIIDAITADQSEVVAYLFENVSLSHDQENEFASTALAHAINHGNERSIFIILQIYQKQKKQPQFLTVYKHLIKQSSKSTSLEKLVRAIGLQRRDFTKEELFEMASWFVKSSEFSSLFTQIVNQLRTATSFSKIKEQYEKIFHFAESLSIHCKIPCGYYSLQATTNWLLEQICFHCKAMNPKLFSNQDIYNFIIERIACVQRNEDYGSLLVALQVAPNKEMALLAFLAAQALNGFTTIKPIKEKFFQVSLEEQKQWLAYALVYRDRSFIPHCHHIIKHHERYTDLLLLALHTVRYIGIKRLGSDLENTLALAIQNILQKNEEETIKIGALNAYVSCGPLSHNLELLHFLLVQLIDARKKQWTHFESRLASLLGTTYEYTTDAECELAVTHLLDGLKNQDKNVRVETAVALTSIPHEKGLFAALEVVQSPDWDQMNHHFGIDRVDITGPFTTFRSRPSGLHENRSAMIKRIVLQLVHLHQKRGLFSQVSLGFSHGFSNGFSNFLKLVDDEFRSMPLHSLRCVSKEIAYPQGSDLIRGLSTRKGSHGFREAVRDVLRKGAGSSQLTDYDLNVCSNTWNKIGHIFASHNKDLFFTSEPPSPYFSVDKNGAITESALIIFPASYYEKEYLRGQARLEREGTFNNVLYRGVPHQWIKAIYLPQRFKKDIDILASNTPLERVIEALTSDLFKGDTIKELDAFRRFLKVQERDLTQESEKPISLVEKLRYLPEVDLKKIEELLVNDGIHFATVAEIKEETAKLRIKKHFLINEHYKNPSLFFTQDEFLHRATDAQLKENIDIFLRCLPQSMHPLDTAKAYLLEVQTDKDEKMRAILRMKALLRGVGMKAEAITHPAFWGFKPEDMHLLAQEYLS